MMLAHKFFVKSSSFNSKTMQGTVSVDNSTIVTNDSNYFKDNHNTPSPFNTPCLLKESSVDLSKRLWMKKKCDKMLSLSDFLMRKNKREGLYTTISREEGNDLKTTRELCMYFLVLYSAEKNKR